MKKKTQYISQLIRSYVNLIDPKSDVQKERLFREKLYDLELETEEPFSIFIYPKIDWYSKQSITPFFNNVSREGIRI